MGETFIEYGPSCYVIVTLGLAVLHILDLETGTVKLSHNSYRFPICHTFTQEYGVEYLQKIGIYNEIHA